MGNMLNNFISKFQEVDGW